MSSSEPFPNHVGVGFQSNRIQLSTSALQEATAYLTSSTQLPGQPDTPWLDWCQTYWLLTTRNDCQGCSMTAGTYSLTCHPKHSQWCLRYT